MWQSLDYYPLTTVVRQTNATFYGILNKIGNGECLTKIEQKLLEDRFIDTSKINQEYPNIKRIFLKNEDVQAYNFEMLDKDPNKIDCIAIDEYSGYKNSEQLRSMTSKVHKKNRLKPRDCNK